MVLLRRPRPTFPPRQNYPMERTAHQKELFKTGLSNVNLWYGHQSVVVIALTDTVAEPLSAFVLPGVVSPRGLHVPLNQSARPVRRACMRAPRACHCPAKDDTSKNKIPYGDRGWTTFEWKAAGCAVVWLALSVPLFGCFLPVGQADGGSLRGGLLLRRIVHDARVAGQPPGVGLRSPLSLSRTSSVADGLTTRPPAI